MYNGIGLQTPRGSGTNGYIQNNKFFVKPKTNKVVVVDAKDNKGFEGTAGVSKKPNKDILEHDRKRQIQLKLVILEDKLVEQGYTDAEISEKLDEARRTLDAASAAEEAGGPNAVIVVDTKVSGTTQTHQIAARKEKQMEILKAAFGIGSKPDNQKKPLNGPNSDYEDSDDGDKPKNFWKNGASDGKRHIKDIKDDVPKDVNDKKSERVNDELEKKKESKTRLHEDSSDTESSGKHVKRTKKKHWNGGHRSESNNDSDSDSNVETNRPQKSSRKYTRNRRHDGDDSDFYSKSGYEKGRKRHDSDHDDSSSDEGRNCGTQKLKQHPKRSGRHYPEDESDTNSREEYETHQLERKKQQQQSRSYRLEKGDSVSHDHRRINNESRGKGSGRYGVESNFGSDRIIKQKKEKVKKSRRWQDIDEDEPDIDYARKLENSRRSRRHDSDEDDSDDVKSDDFHERSNESDSGTDSSDYRHEKNDNSKSLGKSGSVRGDDLSGRSGKSGDGTGLGGEGNAVENDEKRKDKRGHLNSEYKLDALMKLEELYDSRRDKGDGSGPDSQGMMRYKRKIEDKNQDELLEVKSRSRNLGREGDRNRELHKDTNTEFEKNSRSYWSKDDQRRDQYLRSSRSNGGRDSEKVEGGVRSHGRREQYHGSRKNDRDYDEHGEDRRQSREEEHGGRKHKREDEEEIYTKYLKDGEHHHGRHGREQEGDRGTCRNERDRQVDSSKRPRCDDSLSSERRRYDNDRHDDRRSRR